MEYIKGNLISNENNEIIFENNNIGYKFIGICSKHVQKLFLHTITNIKTKIKTIYAFSCQQQKDLFAKLNKIKGFGPISAFNLLKNNQVNIILDAQKTGNLNQLNYQNLKPSLLAKIIPYSNISSSANMILVKNTLIKYGFKSGDINQALKDCFKINLTLDKNIINVIKRINFNKNQYEI